MNSSFKPGQVWRDTQGKPIQAHGFSVFFNPEDHLWYWYGENKERTVGGPFNTIWHWGVRCYVSRDMYNWEDKGLIIPPQPDDLHSPLHPTYQMDRPHIIYCEKTNKYVAWLKIVHDGGKQFMCVMQADQFLGPYEFVHKVYKPVRMDTGDFTLTIDPATKKAYIIFDRPHFEIVTATLNDTYTEANGEFSEHYTGLIPPYSREGPTFFERNGKRYLITSGVTNYYPNPSQVCVFDDWHSEYLDLGNPCIGKDADTSFFGQFTCVVKVPDKDLYIAMADRWRPNRFHLWYTRKFYRMVQYAMGGSLGKKMFKPDLEEKKDDVLPGKLQHHIDNTSISRYVWLPITWNGDKPEIHWHDEWRYEDFS